MADYNLFRLDDRIFWALLISGLIFCIVHASRRAFRQPLPTDLPKGRAIPSSPKEEVERYTLFQRIFHWVNSIAVMILIVSGWMIYQPKKLPLLEGTPSRWFFWHSWGASLLLVGIASHIIYESFIANRPNPMVIDRTEMKRLLLILKNFFGLSGAYPSTSKYHPGQIFFHWAVTGNLFLIILTGSLIWKPLRELLPLSLFGIGWDFIFYGRLLHGFFSATLIAGLIGHIYFALFIKKNWGETRSMITGRV